MSAKLVETLEAAMAGLAQEFDRDASVMVQFAAGDWVKIKAALKEAKDAIAMHDVADAAGVVSHTTSGQPIPAEARLDSIPHEHVVEAVQEQGVAAQVAESPVAAVEITPPPAVAVTTDIPATPPGAANVA
jgi:hypothetical protein